MLKKMKNIKSQIIGAFLGVLSVLGFAGMANAQCNPGELEVFIDVVTDNWGFEVYWELAPTGAPCGDPGNLFVGGNILQVGCAGGGNQTASAGGYASNATTTEGPFCLVVGNDYDIISVDDWGDGEAIFNVIIGGVPLFSFTATGANNTFTFNVNLPDNNLVINQAYYDTLTPGVDSTSSTYYTQTPIRQAEQDLIWFAADVFNQGVNAQTNVTFNASVVNGGSTVFNGNAPSTPSIAASGADVAIVSTAFTPTSLGTYDVTLTTSSDSTDDVPANNTVTRAIEVTDTVYARDAGASTGSFWFGGGTFYNAGQLFEVFTADTATSISVMFGTFMPAGSIVSYHLWDGSLTTPIASASFHTITQAELGTWVTLQFDAGDVPLAPGAYIAGYETFTDTVTFEVAAEAAPPQTSFVDVDKDGTWGFTTNTLFVRLNTKAPAILCNLGATVSTTSIPCPGQATGTAKVTPTGGTAPFTYQWDDPGNGTTDSIGGLIGGVYNVVITDANACTYNVAVTVTQPDVLVVNGSATNVTCNGGTDGIATVNTTGGTTLTYLWDDLGAQTTPSATGLAAGTYTVVVTDGTCGSTSAIVVVTEPAAMALTFNTTVANCGLDGGAIVTVVGGTSPFTYAWNDPASQVDSNAVNLLPGSYIATVTDGNGCVSSDTATVTGTPSVVIDSVSVASPSSCGLTDGTATVFFTGGTGTIFFSWNDPLAQNTSTANTLAAGTYQVIVSDALLCSDTATGVVTDPGAPSLLLSGTSDVNCLGGADGSASVLLSGGTGPFVYSWDDVQAQTTANAVNLPAGNYTLTVTDANTCTAFVSATIGEPSTAVVVDSITTADIACNGQTNGTLSAFSSGGTGAHAYSWTPSGSTSSTVTGATAGTHTVTVTDANGCTVTDSRTISEPTALGLTTTATNITCFGNGDGSIDLMVTGGTGPFSYLWSPGGSTVEDPGNLAASGYSVVVTDANGCTSNAVASISEPTQLLGTAVFTNETVAGVNDGSITVTPTGGDLPYSPTWTGPNAFSSTSLALANLEPGTYNLTLTDASGCEFMLTQVIAPGIVGISEVVNNVEFSVYPNPNTGQFIVELNNLDNNEYTIEIRNIIGQLVVNETVNDSNGNFYKKMNLNTGKNGVYFISLVSESGKITKKLIVY